MPRKSTTYEIKIEERQLPTGPAWFPFVRCPKTKDKWVITQSFSLLGPKDFKSPTDALKDASEFIVALQDWDGEVREGEKHNCIHPPLKRKPWK